MLKKFLFFILKPLSFLPALAMMALIFSFSAQTGVSSGQLSYKVSYKLVETGSRVLDKPLDDVQIDAYARRIEGPVRKLAHMTEYFILAITVALPFYVYGLRGFPLLLVAGAICVGFACTDEYHQSFVAGRGPSLRTSASTALAFSSVSCLYASSAGRCWPLQGPCSAGAAENRNTVPYTDECLYSYRKKTETSRSVFFL